MYHDVDNAFQSAEGVIEFCKRANFEYTKTKIYSYTDKKNEGQGVYAFVCYIFQPKLKYYGIGSTPT